MRGLDAFRKKLMLVCGYSTPYGMSMKICPESVGGIRVAHRAPEWRRHHSAVKARQNRTGQMEANSGTDTGEPMKFLSLATPDVTVERLGWDVGDGSEAFPQRSELRSKEVTERRAKLPTEAPAFCGSGANAARDECAILRSGTGAVEKGTGPTGSP